MKILLLGKNGQLGHELQQQLSVLGEVIALGREQVDMTDLSAVAQAVRDHQPEVIVNASAYTAVDKAESDQITCYLVNSAAPSILATEAKAIGALLVHYSTDYVFDGTKTTPYLPDDQPNPINYYGYAKLMGEEAIRFSGCAYLILRTSWVYHEQYGNNFFRTMQRLAREREVLKIVADQQGIPNNAVDLARDTVMILSSMPLAKLKEKSGIYHLTAEVSQQTTWFDFACSIIFAMPESERQCREVLPIGTVDYPTPAKRPLWSVMQRVLPS
jgi:dTDP-4-dehydrorhamnose reductase